eukprot:TRINITY_DN15146_c0_g1_i1.p1 TRINITY_DN15146_c0_g1~~TRINITY_DN15146_c0_g1_i1.p1  ORF type:complete len:492 (-),score=127.47 TRINITY_DN15146_c0_g1_i1:1159-2634(-)
MKLRGSTTPTTNNPSVSGDHPSAKSKSLQRSSMVLGSSLRIGSESFKLIGVIAAVSLVSVLITMAAYESSRSTTSADSHFGTSVLCTTSSSSLADDISPNAFVAASSVSREDEIEPNQQDVVSKNSSKSVVAHDITQCLQSVQMKAEKLLKPYLEGKRYLAIVDAASHENVGDSMIVQGEIEFIRRMGFEVSYMCGTAQDGQQWFKDCNFDQFGYPKNEWLALAHGGGNWGDVWLGPHLGRRNTVQKFGDNGVDMLQMPISVWWGNQNSKDFQDELAYWNSWKEQQEKGAGTRSKFAAAFRQQDSFDFMKEKFPMIPAVAAPDMAFFMQRLIPTREPIVDVLFLLRGDKESKEPMYSYQKQVRMLMANTDVTYQLVDWTNMHSMLGEEKYAKSPRTRGFDPLVRITQGVRGYSRARVIVTNRLHASILAFLMNKPHIIIENTYGKIKGTRDLAFEGIESCSEDIIQGFYADDIAGAIDQVKRILGKDAEDY